MSESPDRLANRCAALLGRPVARVRRLQGGDLSTVFRLILVDGDELIAKTGPMVAREAVMLRAIAATGAPTPAVIACADDLLLMEALPEGGHLGAAWDDLAAVLLRLHGAVGPRYGWAEDYGFGPVAIPNGWSHDWPAFWAERRLLCHLDHVPASLGRRLEALARAMADHLPARPPASLLHGDLWGGNILVEERAVAGLIDPACYHGDREVDAAMLTLFDHPPERFLEALALAPGWQARLPAYRLWPLLVHLRLFGASYAGAVDDSLKALGC